MDKLKILKEKIKREKKKLIKKAKETGIYENFGQKEVRKLRNSLDDKDLYGESGELIELFNEWCQNYSL